MKYLPFGAHTGLRVSEYVLGTAMFGTRWGYGAELSECEKIVQAYLEAGGNFIDTADTYQAGESEEIIGSLTQSLRDEVVIASKYTENDRAGSGVLQTGNSRKTMIRSVERSLKRLKTDRLDMLWVHVADQVTPVEEILRGLDDLARSGKIIYAGFSNFPAWRISRATAIAELRNTLPVAGLQFEYSLVERTPDREFLPMASALELGMVAWSPLGGGVLTGKYRAGATGRKEAMGGGLFHAESDGRNTAIIDLLEVIGRETSSNPARVAIAWVRSRGVLPILGPRSLAQFQDTLLSTEVTLSAEQVARLNDASAIELGYPHAILASDFIRNSTAGGKAPDVIFPSRYVA
ncbi:aryl-alcohol dehydrogenase-like predicted oxidoreductase [Neorhizobium galegae]|uniref:aldo/keto reductase n=1 Tax=Neorhizobium galegae TaxID=399 RepID=UPI001AEAD820|nr:aldo/keto reductase [Neorhizobium galegae]MBP2562193.1 aryl-alcohol dehydrogenase-like predicted oxidoreductase [Neorhizobium galegae]MDQ0133825.1 aryl-alcohol dehydrogenase-like predicted oxidoreductase [Neorhizobium galegae]